MNKCRKCVWGTWLTPNMVYCMFPSCFKDKEVKERMPKKPKKPCKHPGCPELTEGNYCKVHQREINREYNCSSRPYKKLYNSSRWQDLRRYVLNKQPLCVECLKNNRITPATVVDHIKPHKGNEDLFYDINNLQSLCKSCHDRKTAKEDGRWKRKVYTY